MFYFLLFTTVSLLTYVLILHQDIQGIKYSLNDKTLDLNALRKIKESQEFEIKSKDEEIERLISQSRVMAESYSESITQQLGIVDKLKGEIKTLDNELDETKDRLNLLDYDPSGVLSDFFCEIDRWIDDMCSDEDIALTLVDTFRSELDSILSGSSDSFTLQDEIQDKLSEWLRDQFNNCFGESNLEYLAERIDQSISSYIKRSGH